MSTPSDTIARYIVRAAFFAAGCLLVMPAVFGQGLYNDSKLFINGVTIYVDGEINIRGQIDNNGLLAFTGDWDVAGQYAGEGVVEANGNMPQRIAHNGQDIYTLVCNGGGPKYIKGSVNISAALHLNHGIVGVPHDAAFALHERAVIHGGNSGSYVDGAMITAGTGYKFFPLGKNGKYAPIEFLNVKGVSAGYSMEVFDDPQAISVDNAIVRSGLYWKREDIYGTFGGSPISVDYQPSDFQQPDKIILVVGTDWHEPFMPIADLVQSGETQKISTSGDVLAPIVMLGEASGSWREADFYFSTALSPHAARADNRNVKLFGDRLGSEAFQLQVFDRWGELVFESRSLDNMSNNGWDGRAMNGSPLPSGTYPYRLVAYDKTGMKLEKKGVITIIH